MGNGQARKVLLVDDDADLVWALGRVLTREGFRVSSCGDGVDAVELLQREPFDFVVTDVQMTELNGLALLAWIRKYRPETDVVVMTAYGSRTVQDVALRNGATMYLEKPIDPALLVQLLSSGQKHDSFTGVVDEIDLFDYVQLLLVTNRSAVLEVASCTGEHAKLFITGGNVVHAETDELGGEEAFFACLAYPGGYFSSLPWSEPPLRSIEGAGTQLLMEAARRKDESCRGDQEKRPSWLVQSAEGEQAEAVGEALRELEAMKLRDNRE